MLFVIVVNYLFVLFDVMKTNVRKIGSFEWIFLLIHLSFKTFLEPFQLRLFFIVLSVF